MATALLYLLHGLAACVGLLFLYAAFFLREDEEKRVQNRGLIAKLYNRCLMSLSTIFMWRKVTVSI
jgi:hypothetical protein